MIKETFRIDTVLIGSDDGLQTYEIMRTWDSTKKKAIIIELYPTISSSNINTLDLSIMHLLNHIKQLNLGCIRVMNLYSTVYSEKPSASSLHEDLENIAYITDVLDEPDIADYEIIIAWGSSLSNHTATINTKIHILETLQEKGLEKNVTQLYTEFLDTNTTIGCHPLYLGLHFSRDTWSTISYPLQSELASLSTLVTKPKLPKENNKRGKTKKCTTELKTNLK